MNLEHAIRENVKLPVMASIHRTNYYHNQQTIKMNLQWYLFKMTNNKKKTNSILLTNHFFFSSSNFKTISFSIINQNHLMRHFCFASHFGLMNYHSQKFKYRNAIENIIHLYERALHCCSYSAFFCYFRLCIGCILIYANNYPIIEIKLNKVVIFFCF